MENCYGFQSRYWEKGETVELDPNEKPPVYFRLLTGELEPTTTSENLKPYSNQQSEKKKPLKPVIIGYQSIKRGSGRKLTEKQKNFIKAYLKKLCGTKAVVAAYPQVKNRNTAGVMAYELMCNLKIKKIIDEQFNKGNCVCDFVDFEITE